MSLVFAGMTVADTTAVFLEFHSPLPYFDEWYSLDLLSRLYKRDVSLWGLFSYQNEHIIFIPRLILFSDYLLFGGRGLFDYFVIFAIQFFHLYLLLSLLRRVAPDGAGRLALAGVVTVLMFSLRQSENFLWGFQVQFVGVFALASLAFMLFAGALNDHSEEISRKKLISAYAMALAATWSMANGLLVSAVLLGLALATRAPIKVTVLTILVVGLCALAYFGGSGPRPEHHVMNLTPGHLWDVALFTATYIGNFLDPRISQAQLLGACGLLAAAVAACRLVTRRDRDPARLALLGIIGFTAASALLTALGRAESGIEQAFSSRYSTGSGVFWSSLLIYWCSVTGFARITALCFVVPTSLMLVKGSFKAQIDVRPGLEVQAYAKRQASDALLLGLKDKNSFSDVNDNDDLISSGSAFLKAHDLSIYNKPRTPSVGQPLTAVGPIVAGDGCHGSIETMSADGSLGKDGVRVSGQITASQSVGTLNQIYIVGDNNDIVGIGTQEPYHMDPTLWSAFAVSSTGTHLRAFVLLKQNVLCELGDGDVP